MNLIGEIVRAPDAQMKSEAFMLVGAGIASIIAGTIVWRFIENYFRVKAVSENASPLGTRIVLVVVGLAMVGGGIYLLAAPL